MFQIISKNGEFWVVKGEVKVSPVFDIQAQAEYALARLSGKSVTLVLEKYKDRDYAKFRRSLGR